VKRELARIERDHESGSSEGTAHALAEQRRIVERYGFALNWIVQAIARIELSTIFASLLPTLGWRAILTRPERAELEEQVKRLGNRFGLDNVIANR
jgi:hypothetical protein